MYYPYNIYDIHENVSASVFTITAIVMSQNMKPSSPAQPPSPAGSQARSMFSGSLFQVGTPHQLSTSMVSYRNFKIFQYTISTQCAYLFTIKLWQNKRSDMQNIGEELGTGTVFMFLYTLLKKWILSKCNVKACPSFRPILQFTTPQPLQVPVSPSYLQILRCSTPPQVGHPPVFCVQSYSGVYWNLEYERWQQNFVKISQ